MTERPLCKHEVLEGDIHELTFLETSRQAVDAMVDILDRLMRETAPEVTLRVVVFNTGNKPQPVAYAVSKLRAGAVSLPVRPALRAVIVEEGFFATILDGVFRALLSKRDRMRIFKESEREKMLDWLRRDD